MFVFVFFQEKMFEGIPARYAVAFVAFVNFFYVYMIRLNVNIVIVAMVNYTAIPHTNVTTAQECGEPEDEVAYPTQSDGEFAWDEKIQSLVSVSFFWGYIITQLIGGRIAEKFGTKYMFAGAQMTAGLVTVCLPICARAGTEFFIAGRILLGLAQVTIKSGKKANEVSNQNWFCVYVAYQIGSDCAIHSTIGSEMGPIRGEKQHLYFHIFRRSGGDSSWDHLQWTHC